jgi:hypothetical protein
MPEEKLEIKLTKKHRAMICEDMIVEFMNLCTELDICYDKPNYTIKDYTLAQFFQWNAKIIGKKFTRNKKPFIN